MVEFATEMGQAHIVLYVAMFQSVLKAEASKNNFAYNVLQICVCEARSRANVLLALVALSGLGKNNKQLKKQ